MPSDSEKASRKESRRGFEKEKNNESVIQSSGGKFYSIIKQTPGDISGSPEVSPTIEQSSMAAFVAGISPAQMQTILKEIKKKT
ncbi:1425_t:CDS:1, partial [Scutellospora calospora]